MVRGNDVENGDAVCSDMKIGDVEGSKGGRMVMLKAVTW